MEEKIEVEREGGVKVEEEEEAAVLPGFRFHPTDEELVGFYLRRKVERRRLSLEIIKEIDIYKYDPWDLPREGVLGEKEWYFFCLRGRKYRNSIRPNRVTGSGFWKATGIDRSIYSCRNSGECIGLKKSLVYYQGSAGKGTKTDWMMHEYRLPSSPDSIQEAEIWTICRIIKRNVPAKRYRQQIGWKEVAEIVDSSSKTSSFGSDCGEEIKNLDCAEDGIGKVCAPPEDWSSGEYVYDSIGASEVLSEGNWDEIGRMVDFMMEPVIADGLVYY